MDSTVPSVFFGCTSHLKEFTADGWTQWLSGISPLHCWRGWRAKSFGTRTVSYRWSEEILGSILLRLNQWISYYLRQVGDISQMMAGFSESSTVSRFDGWRAEDTESARMVLTCSFCTCLFCPPRSSCHLGVCFTRVPFCTFPLGEFCSVPVCWPDSGNSQHKAKDIVRSKPNLP